MEDTELNANNQNTAQSGAESSKTQVGPVVGSIIVIVIIILGGLYFIGKKASEEGAFAPTAEEILESPDQALQMLAEQGTSDEITAIEEDLNATELNNIDTELKNVEAELAF